ncbi:MAG: hypothetical protein ACI4O6_07980 [Dysosmobacter sp.]
MQSETTTSLSTFLGNCTTILNSCVEWVAACGDMVLSTPLLLVPTVMGIGLIGISIIKRFV